MMTPRMLDIRQLKHIFELDRYKNYHRAADALFISQPALTKSIQQIEELLGVSLFDRESGGIRPTPSCSIILEHARRVFLELDAMQDRLESLLNLRGGELRVGTGPIMAEYLLPDPLRTLLVEFPELRVEIIVDDWSNLPRLLREGSLHAFVIDVARLRDEADLEIVALGRVENILVCRSGHPIADCGTVTPPDFLRFPLALPRMTEHLGKWLLRNAPGNMSPQSYYAAIHRIQCQSVPLLRRLVRDSDCISGGPRGLFDQELSAGTLVELHLEDCDALFSEPCVSYLKGRTLPPAVHRFVELLCTRGTAAASHHANRREAHAETTVPLATGVP
ncbi:MAG: LysR family transcriptional regulator [Betaproteobacteria bacterium]